MAERTPDSDTSNGDGLDRASQRGDGDRSRDPSEGTVSRRSLLRASAGIGATTALAGCGDLFDAPDVTSYSFTAAPVALSRPAEPPAYELRTLTEYTTERTPTVAGNEVEIKLTSHAAIYDGDVDTLGLLSSPQAKVATQATNPLATNSIREILVSDLGGQLLQAVDLTERSAVNWTSGPELVETGSGELLGQDAEITSFAGVTERSGFVLFTAARVTDDGDAVFAATGLDRDGDAASLVGPDGHVTADTVAAAVERLAAILPSVTRDEVGVRLAESAHIETDGDAANYIRVVVDNRYADRTLYSVSLFTQFFDSEGAFIDAAQASVPRLDPDDRFEGYIPYFGDSVAGYAVEATHSTRNIASASPEAVEVVSHSRDGDTVAVTIRNASGRLVPFTSLEVTFYGEGGTLLGSQERNVANLEEGERRDFDVVFATPAIDRVDHIADYAVETVQYGGGVRYVR